MKSARTVNDLAPLEFYDFHGGRVPKMRSSLRAFLDSIRYRPHFYATIRNFSAWLIKSCRAKEGEAEIRVEESRIILLLSERGARGEPRSMGVWPIARFRPAPSDVRVCRGCGCTTLLGCRSGCWWVEDDLCSRCKESPPCTP